jgi:hypothetical protein
MLFNNALALGLFACLQQNQQTHLLRILGRIPLPDIFSGQT